MTAKVDEVGGHVCGPPKSCVDGPAIIARRYRRKENARGNTFRGRSYFSF